MRSEKEKGHKGTVKNNQKRTCASGNNLCTSWGTFVQKKLSNA